MQSDMVIGPARSQRARIMAAVLAATLAASAPARAQALPDTPEAFGTVLKSWAAQHAVERAFVVVRREGRIVYKSAFGGIDPDAPVHLASLSKAITGACVATLVRDRRLAFDTPVSSALAKLGGGKFADPRFSGATVAQLLTHRAGFGTKQDDPASGPALVEYLRSNTAKAPPTPTFLSWALNQPLINNPGAMFVYSNTGYLALGAIIEQATSKQYAPYCRDAVLAPLGLSGDLEPNWRVMWSYGGWRLTARDYLSFLDLFAADDQRLGAVAKSWMLDPAGKMVAADGIFWYGLGTYVRRVPGGVNVRHWGAWAYNMVGRDGPLKTSFVTLAVRQSDGTAWFVHVEPRIHEEGAPGLELERGLLTAYRGVTRWN